MASLKKSGVPFWTQKTVREVRSSLALLDKEVKAAQRFLLGAEERQMNILIPLLTLILKREEELHRNSEFEGVVSRFSVAKEFSDAGIKMDFRYAECLLMYAVKKKKACLVFENTQHSDDQYGSDDVYQKIHGKK